MKRQLAKTQSSTLIDKAIVSAIMVESIIIAFSIREDSKVTIIGAIKANVRVSERDMIEIA